MSNVRPAALALAFAAALAAPACAQQHAGPPTIAIAAPNATLTLELARNNAQRSYGLMNRTSLPPHTGMIFVFKNDGPESFWMKDTLIPLDMVFVGGDGVVTKVFDNVPVLAPKTADESIPIETARAKFVIELPAGEAAKDGIAAGTRLDVGGVPPALE